MIPPAALDCLYGLARGDAFGGRWYRVPYAEREDAMARRVLDVGAGPWPWTDVTAQALALCSHLDAFGGAVDQDGLARAFADAYAADPHRKYGPAMHDVLRRIGAGEPWRRVVGAQFGGQGSYGNGAAMRVAPLGAWLADADPGPGPGPGAGLDAVADAAARQAAVSHHHPEAAAGAVAVALAAALAARSRGGPPPADLLRTVGDRVPAGDVRGGLRVASRFPEGTPVRHAADVLGSGYGVSAPDTVPFALWCAAMHLDDLAGGLWSAVAGQGDMDTTCAMAGGVHVARTGVAGLPPAWHGAAEPLPGWVPRPPGTAGSRSVSGPVRS
ncbi:ADP-ribosylglycohydrolase family protein [Streptomyces sp. NPDC002574]|uniref:ADP-ribosylglycohydrolase family protein n=1 Tax=Streptomyces sp. NPDC002574 TaxID=3364652 RepID=UPI0036A3700E